MILTIGMSVFDKAKNEYILDEPVGNGGFGIVYKAHRKSDGVIFAIKTLQSDVGGEDGILTLKNEMNLAEGIISDHVIHYEFAHNGSIFTELPPYIIMEYAPDGTLADLITQAQEQREQFSIDAIQDTLQQLASGMQAINKVLVHRDVKPQNILRFGRVLKISDFGLSKYAYESTRTKTMKGYGTALYIAPEAWKSGKNTIQMDIYSMGIVFYLIATLQYPYILSDNFDVDAIRNAHLLAPVNRKLLESSIPQNTASVIIRMLEKSTDQRYKNWEEILHGLEVPAQINPELKKAVERAMQEALTVDIMKQEKQAAEAERKKREQGFIDLVQFQFNEAIYNPIKDYVEMYNSIYQGSNQLMLLPQENRLLLAMGRIRHTIKTTYGTSIVIEVDVLQKKNFVRRVPTDRVFGGTGYREENYLPECEQHEVMAWGYFKADFGIGFNVLLLKSENKENLYGDWVILENTTNGFGRSERVSPFAFSFDELPRGVAQIRVLSEYDSKPIPFAVQYLYDFIQTCIAHDKYKI